MATSKESTIWAQKSWHGSSPMARFPLIKIIKSNPHIKNRYIGKLCRWGPLVAISGPKKILIFRAPPFQWPSPTEMKWIHFVPLSPPPTPLAGQSKFTSYQWGRVWGKGRYTSPPPPMQPLVQNNLEINSDMGSALDTPLVHTVKNVLASLEHDVCYCQYVLIGRWHWGTDSAAPSGQI